MKLTVLLVLVLFLFQSGCTVEVQNDPPSGQKVNAMLDNWHKAAADADFERYFSHFQNDSSIFMGTDATERWTVAEFRPWSKPYFDRGSAWSFKPVERHIYFSDDGNISWFDEVLDTPNLGPSRGSGVLIDVEGEWKIAHYNLSIPIPNAIVDTVVSQVDEALKDSTEGN
ncbi:nuclear transport factor 2 family protein [Balneolaceae bacterium YR4-1]|uniref:Nuclear transport factor 2 family protein n=2 Tax=Halalkalibaculum roseum TaxID=2709311 RepID=A0A6M1SWI2_9BACT|nr:nuclear transport factor 2 family protein [Halalkalibaculum roseum]NGP77410.1 nuclear transport factor 2 family protein [Halalkalibaculum roseum]